MYKLAALVWGTLMWSATTILLQAAGHWWVRVDQTPWILGWFAAAIPYAHVWTMPMYDYLELHGRSRMEAAVRFAWINLLLNSVTLLRFEAWFPNMPPQSGIYVGAWLMWVHALGLASAWLPERKPARRS
ncbi:DUF5367 family protein [Paenibacillus thermoaerophilus]|uniref:DUF5367 family protein n=1 Tax=Paenibacillus thermoaerophilus TaxID=1215385 RepID=A0ABW2V5L2_9BACL|nr:DUF5367 family protein [Paenibacillus thermoaerophilus]TMV17100.1 hypothetical protein FE781_07950 [Paenibacillus thermoaerophilus]